MDQIIVACKDFGMWVTSTTHLDCTSILVGMVIFEIPAILRRVFGRFRGQ